MESEVIVLFFFSDHVKDCEQEQFTAYLFEPSQMIQPS